MTRPAGSGFQAQVFVSYAATEDAEPALRALRSALGEAGYEATGDWVTAAGQRFAEEPDTLISAADAAVVLITRAALTSTALFIQVDAIRKRQEQDPDFRVIPLLIGDISWRDLTGPLSWLATFYFPQGPTAEERIDDLVNTLRGEESSQPPLAGTADDDSAAESARAPAMSQSTRSAFGAALGQGRGDGDAVDASAALISALRYAHRAKLPGVTSAMLTGLAHDESAAQNLIERLDRMSPEVTGTMPDDAGMAFLTAKPPQAQLLALAADCAEYVSGQREIHLRHLIAATVLTQEPPLRPDLLAELGVSHDELRQLMLQAAREQAATESAGAWEAMLAAAPLRLAGGLNTDRVDPTRGIPLDQDDLGFSEWASMFAAVIADGRTPMPLSVGIFGEWGSGKSYFMGLLRSEIDRFSGPGRHPYLASVKQIGFNAWHYADTNLWASLGDEIFRQLAGPGVTADESRRQLRQQLAEGQTERQELQARTAQAKSETARLEHELRQATAERQFRARDLLAAVTRSEELNNKLTQVWRRLGISDDEEAKAALLVEEVRGARHDTQVLRSLLGQRRTLVMAAICLIALLVTLAASYIPARWGARLRDDGAASTIALVLSFGLTLLGRVRRGLTDLRAIATDLSRGVTAAADERTHQAVSAALDALTQAEADEKVVVAQLDQVTVRVGELARQLADLAPGQRLYTFLAERAASAAYAGQLGLISTIRKDFEYLVELLRDWREEGGDDPGRRRIDRIVLYIDDLDRCRPQQVVEVLQAVHLLLALDLFVVVVGVDPRWLTRSVRQQFQGILDAEPHAHRDERFLADVTATDYLEKIFNIPFVLPGIPANGLAQLVRRLAADPGAAVAGVAGAGVTGSGTGGPGQAAGGTRGGGTGQGAGGAGLGGSGGAATGGTPVESHSEIAAPPGPVRAETVQPLTEDELGFLAGLEPFIATPRDAKRMFNLYRMLRSTRDLSNASTFLGDANQPGDFQVVAMLLAMLTADAYLMRHVLDATPRDELAGGLNHRPDHERWQDFADGLVPRRASAGWENQIVGLIPARDVRAWHQLAGAAARTSHLVAPRDLTCFRLWAPRIRRFSYLLSSLSELEAADAPGGHPAGQAP